MKKFILLFLFVAFSLFGFTQDYYSLVQNGKDYFKLGDYEKAYVEFYKAERISRNSKVITSEELGELYFYIGKSMFLLDSTLTERIEENLFKAVENGNQKAFLMMAYNIPVINPDFYLVLTNIQFKTMGINEMNYCKALICAKMPDKKAHMEAFVFLEKALKNNYKSSDLLSNKTMIHLNAAVYYDKLLYYKVIDSKYNYLIKYYVENQINSWQKKGKFEKSAAYAKRVNETSRKQKAMELGQFYIDSIGMKEYSFTSATNEYDADNETFSIQLNSDKNIYIRVPIDEAPSFDRNFKNVTFKNPQFTLYNDNFELVHLELVNPENYKTYTYESKEVATFNTELITYNFEAIDLENLQINTPKNNSPESPKNTNNPVDIELNIPINSTSNNNAYALIIGNEDYLSYQTGLKKEQNVEFAIRDANLFKEYCIKTLGIPAGNVLFYSNSGTVAMNQGISQMNRIIQSMNGQAEVIFYYAGHGYPNSQNNEPCLIPVDVTSSSMEFSLPLNRIIQSFTQYPSKKVVLFLDACFTGGARNMGLMASRGVKIVPKNVSLTGNVVVFSASDENQSALPYEDQKHGLFTYYLLKKIQETNGDATLSELDAYLSKQVSIKAAIVNKQEQTPKTNFSPAVLGEWENWKLK
jgi:hypothetical protein